MDYKEAGVDIEVGNQFVDKIKGLIGEVNDDRLVESLGGFAAVYKMDDDRYITASTDGVGTKLLLAIETGIYDTIGIDLVAMCVNDLICNGSRPLFFLDYFATGRLKLDVGTQVLSGIQKACVESGCLLIGGETAEMPGVYADGHFDLAGFSVGEVYAKDYLNPTTVKPGMTLIGLPSSGFHSNGFSLIRKLLTKDDHTLKQDLLTPTQLYVKPITQIIKEHPGLIGGCANITGGGVENIERMNPALKYKIESVPDKEDLPKFVQEIIGRTQLSDKDLYKTFNMGIGMVLASSHPDKLIERLQNYNLKPWELGRIV